MKTISRTTVRIAFVLILLGAVGIVCCRIFSLSASYCIGASVLFLIGCGFYLDATRCPHCKRYVRIGLRPFSENAGYCPKCGKLVEYRFKKHPKGNG